MLWVLFLLGSSCNFFCGCVSRRSLSSYTSILNRSPWLLFKKGTKDSLDHHCTTIFSFGASVDKSLAKGCLAVAAVKGHSVGGWEVWAAGSRGTLQLRGAHRAAPCLPHFYIRCGVCSLVLLGQYFSCVTCCGWGWQERINPFEVQRRGVFIPTLQIGKLNLGKVKRLARARLERGQMKNWVSAF